MNYQIMASLIFTAIGLFIVGFSFSLLPKDFEIGWAFPIALFIGGPSAVLGIWVGLNK